VTDAERKRHALALFQQAYRAQMAGRLDRAVELYQASIACHPTAEAHTFLGWTYGFQDRLDEAIAECKRAIALDPEFGNPYNDIGSYLLKRGEVDEAISWLERALRAKRYEARHYPHCNLGRAYWDKGMLQRAIDEFEQALALAPDYPFAVAAMAALRKQLN
jgi:tetratricopeptide (TPR) repeat protein